MNNTVGGCTDYGDSTGDWNWKWNNPNYYDDYFKSDREGWICPKCGRVFAPWVKECPYCGKHSYSVTFWNTTDNFTIYETDDNDD